MNTSTELEEKNVEYFQASKEYNNRKYTKHCIFKASAIQNQYHVSSTTEAQSKVRQHDSLPASKSFTEVWKISLLLLKVHKSQIKNTSQTNFRLF